MVKNPSANPGDIRDTGSIPGLGRSSGGGNGNPFQYSCLENSMDRGAQETTVHRVAQSRTGLKQLSTEYRGLISCMQCSKKRSIRAGTQASAFHQWFVCF